MDSGVVRLAIAGLTVEATTTAQLTPGSTVRVLVEEQGGSLKLSVVDRVADAGRDAGRGMPGRRAPRPFHGRSRGPCRTWWRARPASHRCSPILNGLSARGRGRSPGAASLPARGDCCGGEGARFPAAGDGRRRPGAPSDFLPHLRRVSRCHGPTATGGAGYRTSCQQDPGQTPAPPARDLAQTSLQRLGQAVGQAVGQVVGQILSGQAARAGQRSGFGVVGRSDRRASSRAGCGWRLAEPFRSSAAVAAGAGRAGANRGPAPQRPRPPRRCRCRCPISSQRWSSFAPPFSAALGEDAARLSRAMSRTRSDTARPPRRGTAAAGPAGGRAAARRRRAAARGAAHPAGGDRRRAGAAVAGAAGLLRRRAGRRRPRRQRGAAPGWTFEVPLVAEGRTSIAQIEIRRDDSRPAAAGDPGPAGASGSRSTSSRSARCMRC